MAKPLTDITVLRVAELPKGKTLPFDIAPDAAARGLIAEELGILALRKLTFRGELAPLGRRDWQLTAELGVTASQACIVTLEPVICRIDTRVQRRFLADMPRPDELEPTPEDGVPIPDDEAEEPLGDTIDLGRILTEAISLALPDYPRKEDAGASDAAAAPPGAAPLDDDAVRPFAGLAALRAEMDRDE